MKNNSCCAYVRLFAVAVLSFFTSPQTFAATFFFDDFNRPDASTPGNGWTTLAGSGVDLQIKNNEAINGPNLTGTISSTGIYRPLPPFTSPVTVSAILKEGNGYGGLQRRYVADLCILNDGVFGRGYCLMFSRSDQNYPNSTVILYDKRQEVGRAVSSFQYGPQIQASVTFSPDGSVSGTASDGVSTFPFSFGPRVIQSSGTNVAYGTEGSDTRTTVFTYPRMDDFGVFLETTIAKRPVIILPGIMGTELNRADNDSEVWLDASRLISRYDFLLFPLLLKTDGVTPDNNLRCSGSGQICSNSMICPYPENCVNGGTALTPKGPLNIPGIYTAYTKLVDFLRDDGGYTEGTNLFIFGYDWRLNLVGEAEKFGEYLSKLFPRQSDRVDIVAHSMGGLLVRAYLQLHPNDQRIASVIYLGTPQRGTPMAYAKLTGATSLVKKFAGSISRLNLNTETFLVQNFPGVYALLPRFDFILNDAGTVPALEPLQSSFARLSNPLLVADANDLHASGLTDSSRVPRSFGINGTRHRTLVRLDYTNPLCPKGLSDPTGDGTVPSSSSGQFLSLNEYMYVDEKHGDLPGNAAVQQQILNILNGHENVKAEGILSSPLADSDGLRWYSCSPIRTRIVDEVGSINGLDAEGNLREEIEDSAQFRFTENEGGFLPFEKTYTVNIDATDNGLFTLQFDHLVSPNDDIVTSTSYADIPISINSRAQLTLSPTNTNSNMTLDVDGDGVVDFVVPANTPMSANVFPAVLINVVQNFSLPKGINQSLTAKVNAAASALARGNVSAVRGQLTAFLNQVSAQKGKALSDQQANTLIKLAGAALRAL